MCSSTVLPLSFTFKAQSNHQQQNQGEDLETEAICLGDFSLNDGWSTQVWAECERLESVPGLLLSSLYI